MKPSMVAILTLFLSTLSLRRATARRALGFVDPDISIHALLAESDRPHGPPRGGDYLISIHALLAESDRFFFLWCILCLYISIHALLAESDPPVREIIQWEGIFLSTLSLRRATS